MHAHTHARTHVHTNTNTNTNTNTTATHGTPAAGGACVHAHTRARTHACTNTTAASSSRAGAGPSGQTSHPHNTFPPSFAHACAQRQSPTRPPSLTPCTTTAETPHKCSNDPPPRVQQLQLERATRGRTHTHPAVMLEPRRPIRDSRPHARCAVEAPRVSQPGLGGGDGARASIHNNIRSAFCIYPASHDVSIPGRRASSCGPAPHTDPQR